MASEIPEHKGVVKEELVAISLKQYMELLDNDLMLECLQNAGVDNWEGYDVAMEEYREKKGEPV